MMIIIRMRLPDGQVVLEMAVPAPPDMVKPNPEKVARLLNGDAAQREKCQSCALKDGCATHIAFLEKAN